MEVILESLLLIRRSKHSRYRATTTLLFLLVRKYLFSLDLGDGVFDKLNNQEVADAAWDAARKTYKQH
jgi:hypothetical protein